MPLPLEGRIVALAETRQLEDLAAMLTKEGATPVRVPLVAILDAEDPAPVITWLRDLIADRFTTLVFMTGEGIRRLVAAGEAAGIRDEVVAALGRVKTITRGPKPGQALRQLGLTPSVVADAPTTAGLVSTLSRQSLQGQTVGVQFHGHDNPPLIEAVERGGATPVPVRPYRYAPAADADGVANLIEKMAADTIDLLVITSSPQVDRLYEVAADRNLTDVLSRGLEKTAIAAVGPIAADALRNRCARVDICPEQGWVMKKLVQVIARELDTKKPRK
ncbi:MAG: uroporphyrinogen III synthase HEM4 [Planctomycetaceae bacterium]|nr:uroporphyrinogen III synthase HEM4 [Planctomycetaceae bacterium]